ncbi:iron-binding zinc finger CDGSH type-domain-containing protein [Paraphysoderma sedebokerense]|nr:iron-binding zinc finger CDGSH type-domain-containing protein [Paraphysoderma sedebokerense]
MSASTIPSDEAVFVQPRPYKVDLEPGKDYWWCSCGRSRNQPFCDGSHKGTAFTPKKVTVCIIFH